MKQKRLKEEKELRKWVTRITHDYERSRCYADIRALVRAVRKDERKQAATETINQHIERERYFDEDIPGSGKD